jgi:uncharacterized membrane protein (UPF0136 family)
MSPTDATAAGSLIQYAQYAVIATAVLVILGGIMGFVKAKSKISLIAGSISGILLGVCFYVSQSEPKFGLIGAAVLLTMLDAMFAARLAKTKKIMPSGVMVIVCSLAELAVAAGVLQAFGMI